MKKALIVASALLTVIIILVFFYFKNSIERKGDAFLYSYVSMQTSFVLEFPNDESIYELYKDSPLPATLLGKGFKEELATLRKIMLEQKELTNQLKNTKMLVAVQKVKVDQAGSLYLIDCSALKNVKQESFTKLLPGASVQQRSFNNQTIYELSSADNSVKITYCFHDDVLLLSFTSFLVEDAIRANADKATFYTDPVFTEAFNRRKGVQLASLTVNFKRLPELSETFLSNRIFLEPFRNFSKITDFAFFDINFNSNAWMLGGQSSSEPDAGLLYLLKGQQPVSNYLVSYVPSGAVSFTTLSLSDYDLFLDQYELSKTNTATKKVDVAVSELERKYKIRTGQELRQLLSGDFLKFEYENLQKPALHESVGIVLLKEPLKFRQFIANLKKRDQSQGAPEIYYKEVSIAEFPVTALMQIATGSFIPDLKASYYCIIEDRLHIAGSPELLRNYIDDYVSSQLLSGSSEYRKFSSALSNRSNYYYYFNISKGGPLLNRMLNKRYARNLSSSEPSWLNYQGFAFQLGAEKEGFLTSVYMPLSSQSSADLELIWKLNFDSKLINKPYVVNNYDSQEKEILVQDEQYKLYLVNASGKILWSVALPGSIRSQVYQVDYYKNGKYQYLFNTDRQLFLIDRNGSNVSNYPIRLSTNATAGLALFDYDNNKEYRVFIPCDNECLFGYDISGRPLEGWNPKTKVGIIRFPVQHINVQGKDMLFFSNTRGDLMFYNRRGVLLNKLSDSTLLSQRNGFVFDRNKEFNKNRFITTDRYGKIKSIFIDGRKLYKTVGTWSDEHFFNAADVAGDSVNEYIFLDKDQLYVYKDDTSIIYNYQFKTPIAAAPQFLDYHGSKKLIGITSAESEQIFLFDTVGKLFPGFPLKGSTGFELTDLRSNGRTNLIVADNEGVLYLYEIPVR